MIRSTRVNQQRQGINIKSPSELNITNNGPVSFSSLSKNKDHRFTQSQIVNRFSPTVKNMLHSQYKQNRQYNTQNVPNRQNCADQYRLFTNIVKNKLDHSRCIDQKYKQPMQIGKGKIRQNFAYGQYSDMAQLDNKIEQKRQRPQSRHKIQKYFSETPILIRPKSSKSKGNLRIKTQPNSQRQNELQKNNGKCPSQARTFPPNQYLLGWQEGNSNVRISTDEVNTSKASLKFDMSPYLY